MGVYDKIVLGMAIGNKIVKIINPVIGYGKYNLMGLIKQRGTIIPLVSVGLFLLGVSSCSPPAVGSMNTKTKSPTITLTDTPEFTNTPTLTPTDANMLTAVARVKDKQTATAALTQAFLDKTATVAALTPPTPTKTQLDTPTPSLTPTLTPTLPILTQQAIETSEAFGDPCDPPATRSIWDTPGKTISPYGNWIAIVCEGDISNPESYLHVFSLDGSKDWRINYVNYVGDDLYSSDDLIVPFHWSKDGRFLYATSPSRYSGCCWIGYYMLLIRLDLETGQLTEMLNYIEKRSPVNFSFSSSDRYLLYIPTDGNDNLYILDLSTWKQRVIELEFDNLVSGGNALLSNNEKEVFLQLEQWTEVYQGDIRYGLLALLNLETSSQKKLISGIDVWETPRPIRWVDDDHVLIRDYHQYWLLNIRTTEITKTEKP